MAAGAPVSTPDVHGGYPLHYAAQMCGGASNDRESSLGMQVLQALLSHKDIVVSVMDGDKRQPLLWAASAGSAKAVLALVRAGAAVEAADKDGLTALHCAASRGHTDCLDTLLTLCGASPDVIDSNGCTALHYAVTLGHADATALLLAHGADPNRQDRKGRSPAHCGCAKGQFETVKLIGAHRANLWLRNARGDFPLHEAAASGRRELVKWLLEMRPSQVNARNNDGRCPLHMAALNDNADMCKILLDAGAQVNPVLRTSRNIFMTPLDCALQRGFRSTAKYLQLHGGVPANRLGELRNQSANALNLQIRDDVTFWGDTSSESEKEQGDAVKSGRKNYKKKVVRKLDAIPISGSDEETGKPESGKTDNTEKSKRKSSDRAKERKSSTKSDILTPPISSSKRSSNKKFPSSRMEYNNEIIINGKTEINIHQTREIIVDKEPILVDRTVETVIPSETNAPQSVSSTKDRRPRSAKFSKGRDRSGRSSAEKQTVKARNSISSPKTVMEQQTESRQASLRAQSTNTSEDTADTVIENKQIEPITTIADTEFIKESTESKKLIDQQSVMSNTSEDVEDHKDFIVEASVHEPPKSHLVSQTEEIKPLTENVSEDVTENIQDNSKLPEEESRDRDTIIHEQVKETEVNNVDNEPNNKDDNIETGHVKTETEKQEKNIDVSDVAADKAESNENYEKEMKSQVDTISLTSMNDVVSEDLNSEIKNNADIDKIRNESPEIVPSELDALKDATEKQVIKETHQESIQDAEQKETDTELLQNRDKVTDTPETKNNDEKSADDNIPSSSQLIPTQTDIKDEDDIDHLKNEEVENSKDDSVSGETHADDTVGIDNIHGTQDEENKVIEIHSEIENHEQNIKGEFKRGILTDENDNERPKESLDSVQPAVEYQKINESTITKNRAGKQRESHQKKIPEITEEKSIIKNPDSKIKRHLKAEKPIKKVKGQRRDNSDEEYSSQSEDLSLSTPTTHKSFRVLDESGIQVPGKTRGISKGNEKKEPRSRSEESKKKDGSKDRKSKRSKIPTPLGKNRLSKSDRHLDKSNLTESRALQGILNGRVPSLPNIHQDKNRLKEPPRSESNMSAPLLASLYSGNESISDVEHDSENLAIRTKKRIKKRHKTREARSAGSDYESSNLIDSGFEPSPRSTRIPKWRNMSDRGVNMASVTQNIQNNIRRYHLERKIFQHLLELKRHQIRAGQHNEAVLVKRAIDAYHQSCASTVGAGRYIPEDYSFKSFERFLYDSLRKLQKTDVEYMKGLPEAPTNPLLCTRSTNRCMHATHAYTGVPCAAYLPKMDHHTIPKIGFNNVSCKPETGFLPNINSKKAVTLELSHGTDKQVISLPTDRLDQNKRYYVTFTVKGQEPSSSNEDTPNNNNAHMHSKSD